MYNEISRAEILFREAGQMTHLHTSPIENGLIFMDRQDYVMVTNWIAISAAKVGCRILAYALMSNHFHFIIEGPRDAVIAFFEDLMARMKRYYIRHRKSTEIIDAIIPGMTPISDLRQLRNEIAYVIRNPFVVREDVNPLAYEWCTGYLYFNPLLDTSGVPVSELKGRALRSFTKSRQENMLDLGITIKDGMANPASFVDYRRAMDFFDNARQFVMWVFKNVEGQVETALKLGELPHLNDEELLSLSFKLCRSMFKAPSIRDLPLEKKKALALKLKNEYGASNGQVARCTNLSLAIVNAMFPMAVKQGCRQRI